MGGPVWKLKPKTEETNWLKGMVADRGKVAVKSIPGAAVPVAVLVPTAGVVLVPAAGVVPIVVLIPAAGAGACVSVPAAMASMLAVTTNPVLVHPRH